MGSIFLVLCAFGADPPTQPKPDAPPVASASTQLLEWKALVGQWRGVGQVRRGSTRGAWQVKQGEWTWKFPKDSAPQLSYVAKDGKFVKSARLSLKDGGLQLHLDDHVLSAEAADGSSGGGEPIEANVIPTTSLVFVAKEPLPNGLSRVSLRLVAHGDRLLMRLERRTPSGRYSPLGEVGFTRVGSRFGQSKSYVECVVTGGLGTIPVRYEGKTYYVCCTGCKAYFEEDPAGVLKEYEARLAERKAEAKSARKK